jgi:CheY-like chemotaxis protein
VVLDVELPDGSGPELAQRLRQIPSLENASIVGMSSYPSQLLAKQFDAFLSKPFPPKRLATLLRRLKAPSAAQA